MRSHFFLCSRAALIGLGAVLMVSLSACNEIASADGAKLQLSDMGYQAPILVEPVHGAAPEFAARVAADEEEIAPFLVGELGRVGRAGDVGLAGIDELELGKVLLAVGAID